MKTFKVFEHPNGSVEAVKQGWSWPAFFFDLIWLAVKQMWAYAGVVLAIFFAIGAVGIPFGGIMVCSWVLKFVLGAKGNCFREKILISRGYDFVDTVLAGNSDGATAVWLNNKRKYA